MKKLKVFLTVLIFGLLVSAFGQKTTMELTFTAKDNGQYVPLDSIFIENLTQGEDTTLYAPDTVLVLDYITSIGNNQAVEENTLSVSQNYPNPFKRKTEVNLYLPEKEDIKITVRDILGRELAQYENTLNRGNHSFAFYSGSEKYYLLTVTGKHTSNTIKMLNANNNTTIGGKCKIVYNEYEENLIGYKSQKAINNFVFSPGDELQYTGYANTIDGIPGSNVIADAPQTNTNYEFAILKGLRCPGTSTVTDIDGNLYNTVLIGTQCWMVENLKTTTYRNGTAIPNVTSANAWSNLTTGAYVWYENDISWKDPYGALYNWFAVDDANGLCPSGWHVPTFYEYQALTNFIGGALYGYQIKSCRQVGSPQGVACSTTEHPRWDGSASYGIDMYGFSGLPSGYRYSTNGSFFRIGRSVYFWATPQFTSSIGRYYYLGYEHGEFIESGNHKECGFSVRCIKD